MRDFFQSSGPSGAGNSAGNAQPSYTLGVIRLVPCGGHGLAGTDLAKKPGDSSRREVMNGAVAGGGKFEPGRDHVADGHVAIIALDRDAVVLTSDPEDIARWGVPAANIVPC